MEIEESGWIDVNERLAEMVVPSSERDVLIDHLADRLVGHFGADIIDCHSGKDDPRRHAMRELAAAAIAHLGPALDAISPDALTALIEAGEIGSPMPPPWDDHWREQPRTASWRS